MNKFPMLISVVGGYNKNFKLSPDLQHCFTHGFRKVFTFSSKYYFFNNTLLFEDQFFQRNFLV